MKKFVVFISFLIVWFAVAGIFLLVGELFGINFGEGTLEYVQIGFSAALAGLLAPTMGSRIQKLFNKSKP